jgi:alpha-L-fucosidase
MRSFLLFFLLISFTTINAQHKDYYPDPDTTIQHRLEEWKDLKFGLLMHWGTYSQWGIVESWSICPEDLSWATGGRKPGIADNYVEYVKKYEALKTTFNPVKFDPSKWAAAAKEAGMKYVVFTTKHHDGFCMFDTKYTDYKVTDKSCPFSSNPKRNIAKEIFSAFRNQNFWIGAYFSKPDWHSDHYWWKQFPPSDRNCNYTIPKYPEQWKKFVDYTHNQVNELMSDYEKIDILWLDGGWVRKKTDDEVKSELMETYENSRWARNPQSQDIDMPRLVKEARAKQPKGLPYPWETCMTMATSWSYVPNDTYKPTAEIIKKLVDIVSKGGNYLLNIGPSPEGELDTVAYHRLKDIGEWMKINGEAIYGTRMYRVFGQGDSIRFTQSKDGTTLYIFLLDIPKRYLLMPRVYPSKTARLELLGSTKPVKWVASTGTLEVILPASTKSASKYVWVLKLVL